MTTNKTKATKRFTYLLSMDTTSHKAGANNLTIKNNVGQDHAHDTGTTGTSTYGTTMTMTVREAKTLQRFLNENLATDDTTTTP